MVEKEVLAFQFSESTFSLSPSGSPKVQVVRKGERKGHYLQLSGNFNTLL